MVRKFCCECGAEDSEKNRLIYAGHGEWVCRNEHNCSARARRFRVKTEAILEALAGNDRQSCGHTVNEHKQMWMAKWLPPR